MQLLLNTDSFEPVSSSLKTDEETSPKESMDNRNPGILIRLL